MPISCRIRLVAILLFALACRPFAAWGQTCPAGSHQSTLVTPPAGALCGKEVTAGSMTVYEYLGIPYAQPPVEALRWKNPVRYSPWTSPRPATAFGSSCPQSSGPACCPQNIAEDCLYLNVWVPVPTTGHLPSNLPVMVFVHGGAFILGSGGSATSNPYDGRSLAARGNVITVTFNYRLGSLGFLVNDKITDATNNNFGFRDQILALQWVKQNIGSFGGDAGKVTLFGESAGAMSVGLHAVSSAQSTGLFNRALMESNPLGLPYKNMTEAAKLGKTFANLVMGCKGLSQTVSSCMRKKSARELVAGETSATWTDYLALFAGNAQDMLAFAPAVDDPQNPLSDPVLKGQPLASLANLGVPVILGTNRDEGYLFVQQFLQTAGLKSVTVDLYQDLTKDLFGSKADTVRMSSVYGCSATPCTTQMTQIFTDYLFTCANRYFAKNAPAADATYLYQFDEVTANPSCNLWPCLDCAGPNSSICHANELPYVFNTSGNRPGCSFDSGAQGVSNAMGDYWTSFASGKAPATTQPGWPTPWPVFPAGAGSQYLLISENPSTASDPLDAGAHCSSFWDSQIGYEQATLKAWSRMLASATAKQKKR